MAVGKFVFWRSRTKKRIESRMDLDRRDRQKGEWAYVREKSGPPKDVTRRTKYDELKVNHFIPISCESAVSYGRQSPTGHKHDFCVVLLCLNQL